MLNAQSDLSQHTRKALSLGLEFQCPAQIVRQYFQRLNHESVTAYRRMQSQDTHPLCICSEQANYTHNRTSNLGFLVCHGPIGD